MLQEHLLLRKSGPSTIFTLVSVSLILSSSIVRAEVPQVEIAGLHSLYTNTDGLYWAWDSTMVVWDFTKNTSGAYTANPCHDTVALRPWQGLYCEGEASDVSCADQLCHVRGMWFFFFGMFGQLPPDISKISRLQTLVIAGNGLSGEIPTNIGELTELTSIELNFNMLSSTIPESFSKLVKLTYLTLWSNQMTGQIPDAIGHMESLVTFDITSNLFDGPLPGTMGNLKSLENMWLSDNGISGSIPAEIGGASNLASWGMQDNMVTGSIPPHMGNLTNLRSLEFGENSLSGSLPEEISQWVNIKELILSSNEFTGCLPPLGALLRLEKLSLSGNFFRCGIPEGIVKLTKLVNLQINDNALTGPLPDDLGNLTRISSIGLYLNELTGSVPSSVGRLTALTYLGLFSNRLSGTLSTSIGLLKKLIYFGMGSNFLSGSLPSEICQVIKLQTLYFPYNQLTGSVPYCFGYMNVALSSLSLHANLFTGQVPASFGSLSLVHTLDMGLNKFSGSIPHEIGHMSALIFCDFSRNFLTGPIPSEFNELQKLEKVIMSSNMLSGPLDHFINSSLQRDISIVDLTNNILSGPLPSSIFELPLIETIALSVNCFYGSIPAAICSATQAEVLSMDGLGAAQGCKDSITFPFSGVALFNYMEGTIPKCVWTLPILRVVHFSGNGFGGSLESLPNYTSIKYIAVAHNQITGTIPFSVRSVQEYDLSYNQISGDLRRIGGVQNDSKIDVQVNRLSGKISSEMSTIQHLHMLEGNIFACDSKVPENDGYYNDFVCGSKTLDGALYVMSFACGLLTLVVLYFVFFNRKDVGAAGPRFAAHHLYVAKQNFYLHYLSRLESFFASHFKELSNIIVFGRKMHALWVFIARLVVLIVILGSPIYILKESEDSSHDYHYSTHDHTYRWFWTFAYISGQLPGVMILIGYMIVITVFFVYFHWIFPFKNNYKNQQLIRKSVRGKLMAASSKDKEKGVAPMTCESKLKLFLFSVLNVGIVVTINGVYIYSSDQNLTANTHLAIQFIFAIFNVMYGLVLLPIFASPIEDELTNINFRLWTLKFNNLFVPCVVTFLSSSSCMQGLLVEAEPIASHYSHEVCDFWAYADVSVIESGRVCQHYIMQEVDVVPLIPPYIYHYQCGSVFLTLYTPVYIYMYSFQLMIPFLYVVVLSRMQYESIPSVFRPMIPAIIWPKYLMKNCTYISGEDRKDRNDEAETESMTESLASVGCSDYESFLAAMKRNPSMLFNAKTVITFDVLHNLSVLLTFGLCSPFLSVIISLAMILKLNMWLYLMGVFLNCFTYEGSDGRDSMCFDADSDDVEAVADMSFTDPKKKIAVTRGNIHPALIALSEVCIPLENVFHKSVWPITWTSAAFFAFLCWDLSADKVGWQQAIWIPCLALFFPVFLWTMTKVVEKWGIEIFYMFGGARPAAVKAPADNVELNSV